MYDDSVMNLAVAASLTRGASTVAISASNKDAIIPIRAIVRPILRFFETPLTACESIADMLLTLINISGDHRRLFDKEHARFWLDAHHADHVNGAEQRPQVD